MNIRRYAVLIKEHDRNELDGLSRYDKAGMLRKNSSQVKNRLLKWLDERDLSDQVTYFGPETIFNTLFLDATEEVRHALADNPEVVDISESTELHVDFDDNPRMIDFKASPRLHIEH